MDLRMGKRVFTPVFYVSVFFYYYLKKKEEEEEEEEGTDQCWLLLASFLASPLFYSLSLSTRSFLFLLITWRIVRSGPVRCVHTLRHWTMASNGFSPPSSPISQQQQQTPVHYTECPVQFFSSSRYGLLHASPTHSHTYKLIILSPPTDRPTEHWTTDHCRCH